MTLRNLARVSATGLLAAGILALAATPALAADVDFGLDLKGSTIALGAEGKPATVSFTNHGTTKPAEVGVRFDATELDDSKVELDLGECTVEDGIADCIIDEGSIPGPGETSDLDVPLVKKAGATGSAGKLTVTVLVDGDANEANNSKTVDVTIAGSGADLRVLAFDVTKIDAENQLTGKPLQPGETSLAYAYVANHGDRTAVGLKVRVSLPEHVTFTEQEGGCEYSTNNRVATCTAEGYPVIPWDQDDTGNKENSSLSIAFAVTVSEDAEGPVSLTGGEWNVIGLGVESADARKARAVAELPAFAEKGCGEVEDQVETDASDNTDGFAVLVAGPAAGGGAGDGEDEPGLPVTGPVAASVAGAGAAVLALGVVLFVVSRRRRVVLVTPGDEK
jgi:hypothetical protein